MSPMRAAVQVVELIGYRYILKVGSTESADRLAGVPRSVFSWKEQEKKEEFIRGFPRRLTIAALVLQTS